MTLTVALVLIFALIGILSIGALYRTHVERMQFLRNEIELLTGRIQKLEQASYKRINHLSLEELENAMAELVVLELEETIKKERIESIRAHLAKVHTPTKK